MSGHFWFLQVMLGDREGALQDLDDAIQVAPHSAASYINRGNLYSAMQQYELAEQDYSTGIIEIIARHMCNTNLLAAGFLDWNGSNRNKGGVLAG